MQRLALVTLMLMVLTTAACSSWRQSSVNPSNWFGNSREVDTTVATDAEYNPLIPPRSNFAREDYVYVGILIDEITDLRIEPDDSGAIVYAEGIAARQGAYEARLIPEGETTAPDENGVLTFRFEVLYPANPSPVGSAQTRRISIAEDLTKQELEPVRLIRVVSVKNARESRRR